jgi:SAM-dependent methyltransferase
VCGAGNAWEVFAEASVDPARVGEYTFASRKLPELMHHRLLRCLDCDVLYASPAPAPGASAKAYQEAAFDSGAEAAFAARTYARQLGRLHLDSKAGALDIGTGDGAFLEELLSAGFTGVQGVEPSLAPIRAAKPGIKKLIRAGVFRPAGYRSGSFSLVTCFQTLEHVDQPSAVAKAAKRLLRPGGAFYTVCHDQRSLSAKLLGKRSPIFDIEHLQLFTPKSLRRMLEAQGYRDVQVYGISNIYPLHYWLKVFPLPAAIKPGFIRLSKALGFGYLPLPLPAGNMVGFGIK